MPRFFIHLIIFRDREITDLVNLKNMTINITGKSLTQLVKQYMKKQCNKLVIQNVNRICKQNICLKNETKI